MKSNQMNPAQKLDEIQRTTFGLTQQMFSALSEIAKCDVSAEGAIAMKYIAEKNLVSVYETLTALEGVTKNA